MKSNYRNYFKEGKLYQWNKDNTVYTVTNVNTDLHCCLDKFGMDMLLKFDKPSLKLEGNTLKVESGNIKASIPTIVEYLQLPKLNESNIAECDLPVAALKYATNFVGTDTKKALLTGVNISNKRINATDSFSAYSLQLDINPEMNITIPKNFIDEIKSHNGDVHIKTDKKILYTVLDNVEYYSVLLEGNYPDVSKIFENVSQNIAKEINTDTTEIKGILNYAMINDGLVTLSDYQITITGDNTDIQSMCNLDMGDLKILLSLAKFRTALSVIDTDEINLKFKGVNAPILLNDSIMLLTKTA